MSAVPRPVDWLLAGYNLILAVTWAGWAGAAWYAPVIAGAHAAAVALPWLLRGSPWATQAGGFGRVVMESYPLLWLLPFWTELGLLHDVRPPGSYDGVVARLDLALFGVHWNAVWMPAMPWPWFSEAMHFMYYAYYPLVYLPPIAIAVSGRIHALRDTTLRLLATYVACYLVYLAVPVLGPGAFMEPYQGALTAGSFYRLTHATKAAGDSLGTAFPSSHVAGSVTIALIAWRWMRVRWAVLITLQAAGVFFATVYTQSHYAIDAVAGLLWACVVQLGLVPAFTAPVRPPASLPVPVLPVTVPPAFPRPPGGDWRWR